MTRRILLATALLAPILAFGAAPPAEPPAAVAGGTPSVHIRGLTAAALAEVADARVAMHRKDLDAALAALRQARLYLQLIRAARPTGEAKALLRYVRTLTQVEDNEQTLADMLPLFNAVQAMPGSPGVATAQQRLAEAKQAFEQNDRAAALKALEAADRALILDETDLPLHAAEENLDRALEDLNDERAPAALTLTEAEKNLLLLLEALSGRPGAVAGE